jgi:hypothetical protein
MVLSVHFSTFQDSSGQEKEGQKKCTWNLIPGIDVVTRVIIPYFYRDNASRLKTVGSLVRDFQLSIRANENIWTTIHSNIVTPVAINGSVHDSMIF